MEGGGLWGEGGWGVEWQLNNLPILAVERKKRREEGREWEAMMNVNDEGRWRKGQYRPRSWRERASG